MLFNTKSDEEGCSVGCPEELWMSWKDISSKASDNLYSITHHQAQRKAQKVLSFTFSSPDEEAGEVRKTVLNYLFSSLLSAHI